MAHARTRALLVAATIVAARGLACADCEPTSVLPAVCVGETSTGSSRFCFGDASCNGSGVVQSLVAPGAPFAVTDVHVDGPLGSRPVGGGPQQLGPGEAIVADLTGVPPAAGTTHGVLVWVVGGGGGGGGDGNSQDANQAPSQCSVDVTVSAPGCAGPKPGDPCHAETCVAGACVPGVLNGPCDDGDPCTDNDTCVGGVCQGQPKICPATPCTTAGVCVAGHCVGGTPVNCDDGNPCTVDTCDPVRGCVQTPRNSGLCDDGDACTTGDHCVAGQCVGRPRVCTDAFACTDDACVGGVCQHTPVDARCDSGACVIGSCQPGAPGSDARGCVASPSSNGACTDDGFACTDDVCTDGGCLHVPVDSRCGTPDSCTTAVCAPDRPDHDASGCAPGPALASGGCAEDGDPCTDDVCNAGSCEHTRVPNWTLCTPVEGAYRRALALATLARELATAMTVLRDPQSSSASSVPFGATLADRLTNVGADMDLVAQTLAGKAGGGPHPRPPPVGLPETPAQERARLAVAVLVRTPRIVSAFVQTVAGPRAATAFGRDDARDIRRRGRLLLRGTKTLKAELKGLQRVSQTFAR